MAISYSKKEDYAEVRFARKVQKVSRIFKNAYQLLYHLKTVHEKDPHVSSDVNVHEIKLAISGMMTAHQWKMLINYPRIETRYRRIRL